MWVWVLLHVRVKVLYSDFNCATCLEKIFVIIKHYQHCFGNSKTYKAVLCHWAFREPRNVRPRFFSSGFSQIHLWTGLSSVYLLLCAVRLQGVGDVASRKHVLPCCSEEHLSVIPLSRISASPISFAFGIQARIYIQEISVLSDYKCALCFSILHSFFVAFTFCP